MRSPFRGIVLASLFFVAGLLVSPHTPLPGYMLPAGAILLLLALAVRTAAFRTGRDYLLPVSSILLLLVFLLLGLIRGAPVRSPPVPEGRAWIRGTVVNPVERGGEQVRARLAGICYRQASTFGSLPGRAVVYLPAGSAIEAGDRIRLLARLDTPLGPRNPGGFDARAYWKMRGVDYAVRGVKYFTITGEGPGTVKAWFDRFMDSLRRGSAGVLRKHLSAETAPFAVSIFTGERMDWDETSRDRLAKSGLMFLFAISGLHAGIIAVILYTLLRIAGLPVRLTATVTVLLLWLYVPFSGANPPVVRAVVMATMLFGARIFGRVYRPGYSLALAFLCLLFYRPDGLGDVGFQLSFAGTGGVLFAWRNLGAVISTRRVRRFRPLLRPLVRTGVSTWNGVAVSFAAFIFTAPIIAWHFGRLPLLSFLAAPFAMVLLSLSLISGLVCLVFSWLPLVPAIYGAALEGTMRALVGFAGFAAHSLPGLENLPVTASIGAVLAGFLFLYIAPRLKSAPVAYSLVGILAAADIVLWTILWIPSQSTRLGVLDVGQGDGILIRGHGRAVIIDGGPPDNHALANQVRLTGTREIDLVFITHGDADHAGGVREVTDVAGVRAAIVGPGTWLDEEGGKTVRRLMNEGVPVYVGSSATVVSAGSLGKFSILYPPQGFRPDTENSNAGSLVISWEVDGSAAVFPGDIPSEVEEQLVREGWIAPADLLHAGHHGSVHSSSKLWLAAVQPEIVTVSCGRNNPYGHPSGEVLRRVGEAGSKMLRTDHRGALVLQPCDGGFRTVRWSEWW